MSRTYKDSPNSRNNRPRRSGHRRDISVRGIRREPPDLRKLGRALIQLALDDAAAIEAETLQAAAEQNDRPGTAETGTAADD